MELDAVVAHYDVHGSLPPEDTRRLLQRESPNRTVDYWQRVAGPDVLFVNVGGGVNTGHLCRYDGTERLVGGHAWLRDSGDDCAEMDMFVPRPNGTFWSHAGRGKIVTFGEVLDIVFVTRVRNAGGTERHVAVGLFLGARWRFSGRDDKPLARVWTRTCLEVPPRARRRFRLKWRGRVRRWAQRNSRVELPKLLVVYDRIRAEFGDAPE